MLRRPLALIAVVLTLAGAALSGCGATSHVLAGAALHHVINKFARTPGQRRAVNAAFCAYYASQVLKDHREHHHIGTALAAAATAHSCAGVLHP
jgi:hypothetical protein